MKREFTAVFKKEDDWFVAWIEEIPGVNTQGRTKKEARENLKEALLLILEANKSISLSNRENGATSRESLKISVPV